jgi:signal transduction histidine kinase
VLYSYAENFQFHHPDLTVDLDLAEDNQQLPQAVRVNLYRICQQALRNVAQHADARHVRITLRLDHSRVAMTVEDDGVGFHAPATWLDWAREGRFGIFEAFQRAAAIGGDLEIDSQPAHGVRLRVTAPLLPQHQATSSPCNE